MANSWYIYNGTGDPFIPSNYLRTTITPTCINGCNVCAVYLLGETDPVPVAPFTGNILTYLINSFATQTSQPTGAGRKSYVYLKC